MRNDMLRTVKYVCVAVKSLEPAHIALYLSLMSSGEYR